MKIKLSPRKFVSSANSKALYIAEIGSNHNGKIGLAKKLIFEAKKAGADYAKFQSWSKETVFSKIKYEENFFLKDDYRKRKDTSLEKVVEKYSISETNLIKLNDYAKSLKIDLISTPFSNKEVDFLVNVIKAPFIKVASMDLNNFPFLKYVGEKKKPIVLSVGMANLQEIDKAISTIESTGNHDIIILHCVSIYPAPAEKINLKRIKTLQKLYPYPIGYSDHSIGDQMAIGAIAMGSCIIEKHFTLDKNMEGWDHKISADPKELSMLIKKCKDVNLALGSERITRIETVNRVQEFRRSIVAARDIKVGERFTRKMLDFKRPGRGLAPEMIDIIIGKVSKKNIPFDNLIHINDF